MTKETYERLNRVLCQRLDELETTPTYSDTAEYLIKDVEVLAEAINQYDRTMCDREENVVKEEEVLHRYNIGPTRVAYDLITKLLPLFIYFGYHLSHTEKVLRYEEEGVMHSTIGKQIHLPKFPKL